MKRMDESPALQQPLSAHHSSQFGSAVERLAFRDGLSWKCGCPPGRDVALIPGECCEMWWASFGVVGGCKQCIYRTVPVSRQVGNDALFEEC